MTMTAADKNEFQRMLNELKEHLGEIRTLENNAILKELSDIKKLQEYANGTQKKHTEQIATIERNLPHTITDCPQREFISKMWEDRIVRKGITGWKVAALAIAVSMFSVIATVFAVFEFILKYNPTF